MGLVTSNNYDISNSQLQKEPIIVLEIEGVDWVICSGPVYTQVKYDDPGVLYDGTYIYDGLRVLNPDKMLRAIDRKGSFSSISQKLEQWDGKASIETFNIKLVDIQQKITQLCTPGVIVPEILNRKVRIFFGYQEISYPEDYLLLFKGYINSYIIGQGYVNFTFTDPSSKRKQVIFNGSESVLTAPIIASDTTLTVSSTSNFYETILNAKGEPDTTITIGLVIDDQEICTYTNADILSGTQVQVTRAQFGTIAQDFDANTKISMFFYVNDNPITIALKTMLSGWNGPWTSNINLRGIINADPTIISDSITFAQGVDLVRDYGLSRGDYIIISDSSIPGNNGAFTIADFQNSNRTAVVVETGILTQENPGISGYTDAMAGFRSKYDTFPIEAGLSLTTDDVLTSQHEHIRDVYVQVPHFKMEVKGQEKSGKEWIETHLFKVVGAYSLTQGARISMGASKPPLSSDLTKFLDESNIVDAKNITVERGLNSRFYYNEVLFNFDWDPLKEQFNKSLRIIDADAQARMKSVSVLSLDCRGWSGNTDEVNAMQARAKRLLQRYKYGAETINVLTNFGIGHTIDGGDTVVLNDTSTPTLQIANTEKGERGIYNRVMEVQERSILISEAKTKLKLLSNNGFSFTDRYATVGPSSRLNDTFTHTTTLMKIKDSFGSKFPGAEYLKWQKYVGSTIRVHNMDYSLDAETTFTLDVIDHYKMILSPPLPFTPTTDMVVEFAKYPHDAAVNSTVKAQFVALDPSATIFSGSSATTFVLDPGYASRYRIGMFVYVHNADCSRYSPNVKITNIVGDIITIGPIYTDGVNIDLGFVPQVGDILQLGGFLDGGSGYKLI